MLHETWPSPTPKRRFIKTARHLFASTMYPFSALQLILMVWQAGEQVDNELADSDVEDANQGDSITGSTVKYTTQEEYDR